MEKAFLAFLNENCSDRPRLLLGLSGGPDSMALFWLLLNEKYPFEVAHVDHGWRSESGEEAKKLASLCERTGIPFHLKKLENPPIKNREDEGRVARLAFFKQIVERQKLEGVFLAHQADDQAETVLKRVFEGASLSKLRGIVAKNELQGLMIYRPLIKIRKSEILSWLNEKKISYFYDMTNTDPRFLRGRLRETLIPLLSDHFGKEVGLNLCRLGESACELGTFLEEHINPYLNRIQKKGDKVVLNFVPDPPRSDFLWKAVVRELFDQQRVALSHATLEMILNHLQKGSCHKSLKVGKKEIFIHRGELTIQ
jgi:tRNA(Ile)-lysidine synthase